MKFHAKLKTVIINLIPFIFSIALFSNPAVYDFGYGGMIYPLNSKSLSMEYEKIDIAVYRGIFYSTAHFEQGNTEYFYIEYRCFYRFKNNGKTQEFMIGFPIKNGNFTQSSSLPTNQMNPQIADFHLQINGKAAGYILYIQGFNPDLANEDYDEAYGFTVNIKKGESAEIEVQYTMVISNLASDSPEICYILKSGHALDGPIKQADITIRLHIPDSIEVKTSPGKYMQQQSETSPYTVISWNLKNFFPDADILFMIPYKYYGTSLSQDKEKSGLPNPSDLIANLQHEMSTDAYFQLTNAIRLDKNRFDGWWEEVQATLQDYYKAMLMDENVFYHLAGIILADIALYPELTPGDELVNKVSARLQTNAVQYEKQDRERYKKLTAAVLADPLNWILNRKATYFLYQFDQTSLSAESNIFIQLLNKAYKKNDWKKIRTELDTALKASIMPVLNSLLASEKENSEEIIDFIYSYIFQISSHNFQEKLEQRIAELTSTVWEKKNRQKETIILEKLMHTINKIFSQCSYELTIHQIVVFNRILLRKAYYSLANFYFGNEFEKSILFYKLALAFGEISPLFDFLVLYGGMSYASYEFETVESILGTSATYAFPANIMVVKNAADFKSIYNRKTLWWQELLKLQGITVSADYAGNYRYTHCKMDLSEKVIAALYTPERLLEMNLLLWPQEPVNDAPCYYSAYNIARAYSRLKKTKESLGWLQVAIALNQELIKLAVKDSDFDYIREKARKEFEKLINL